MIYVNNVVSHVEGVQILSGQPLAPFHLAADPHPVISFKNLMVGIKANLGIITYKAFVYRLLQMFEMRIFAT